MSSTRAQGPAGTESNSLPRSSGRGSTTPPVSVWDVGGTRLAGGLWAARFRLPIPRAVAHSGGSIWRPSRTAHDLVLVIDDEPQILRALRINLTVRGYQVITASTGAGERAPPLSTRLMW